MALMVRAIRTLMRTNLNELEWTAWFILAREV
jgi:hypothetical protein